MLIPTHAEAELLAALDRFITQCRGHAPSSADVAAIVRTVIREELRPMSDRLQTGLDQLRADITAQNTVIASATTAFAGLAQQLADALAAAKTAGATDAQLAEVTAVHQGILTNNAALSAAIPANTPATPGATTVTAGDTATLTAAP